MNNKQITVYSQQSTGIKAYVWIEVNVVRIRVLTQILSVTNVRIEAVTVSTDRADDVK
jgi:hypothetical protein